MSDAARTRPVHLVVLALLVALAAGLRLSGIGRLLPHRFEPDAFVVYMAEDLRDEPGRVREQEFAQRYPTLLARTAALVPKAPIPLGLPPEAAERAHLARAGKTFHDVRVLIALFAIALVPLTFLLARRFSTPVSALVAAFLVATSLLHLAFSSQARPHGAFATFALATVLVAVQARARRSVLLLFAASVCAGLSLGVLQTGVFLLPPIAVAAWLLGGGKLARVVRAAAAVLVALAVAFPFNDFLPVVDEHGITMSGKGGHPVLLSDLTGGGVSVAWRTLWGHDPALTVLALAGLAWLVARWWRTRPLAQDQRDELLVVCAHAVPYAGVLLINEHTLERFFLPLLPALACCAAFAVQNIAMLAARVSTRPLRSAAHVFVFAAIACVPVASALRFVNLARAPDTYERAAAWMKEHVAPADKVVAITSTALPLLHARDALDHALAEFAGRAQPWLSYQGTLPDAELAHGYELFAYPAVRTPDVSADEVSMLAEARRYLDAARPRWIVIEDSRFLRSSAWSRCFFQATRERAGLAFVARGELDDDARESPNPYQSAHYLAFRMGEISCWGARIEVYRLSE